MLFCILKNLRNFLSKNEFFSNTVLIDYVKMERSKFVEFVSKNEAYMARTRATLPSLRPSEQIKGSRDIRFCIEQTYHFKKIISAIDSNDRNEIEEAKEALDSWTKVYRTYIIFSE